MFTSPQKMLTALLTGRQCIQPRTIQITQQLVAGYVRMCAMDHWGRAKNLLKAEKKKKFARIHLDAVHVHEKPFLSPWGSLLLHKYHKLRGILLSKYSRLSDQSPHMYTYLHAQ